MNTCACGQDGVLQLQGAWYCREHAGDGALEAVRLVAMWTRPQYAVHTVGIVAQVFANLNVPLSLEAQYWCSECEEDRFTDDDCTTCGCGVYLKSELEDEDDD